MQCDVFKIQELVHMHYLGKSIHLEALIVKKIYIIQLDYNIAPVFFKSYRRIVNLRLPLGDDLLGKSSFMTELRIHIRFLLNILLFYPYEEQEIQHVLTCLH